MTKFSSPMVAVLPWKEPRSQRKGTCPWGRARGESPQSKGQVKNVKGNYCYGPFILPFHVWTINLLCFKFSNLTCYFWTRMQAEKEARKKQKVQAFQQSKQKSKSLKNSKRWKWSVMVPRLIISSAVCYINAISDTGTRQKRVFATIWCAVCYSRYTSRSTGYISWK